mmetsp:Transcript_32077/g.78489  ORF Transcript_32077/g.78489 Transcript_32077/m.78489 type:complete len:210 (+) Transcript_32077:60-689(+)
MTTSSHDPSRDGRELHADCERLLFSEQQIATRVDEMAAAINRDFAGKSLVVVGILKGCFMFMADLVKRLKVECQLDMMALSSYGNRSTTTGAVRVLLDLRADIEGKDVLVIEDIVDTGYTLQYLLMLLSARKPHSLSTAVLLHKKERTKVDVRPTYLGFEVPNVFVVGFGLDYAERHRQLPYIAELKDSVWKTGDAAADAAGGAAGATT